MIDGLDHAALSVSDVDRSIAFYHGLLGFEVIRVFETPPGSPLGDAVGMPGCIARIAHLRHAGKMVELLEYRQPSGRPIPRDYKQADLGWIHLGLKSTDARADYARLKAQGVRFVHEPIEFRPNVWIAYFYGPDGEMCELRETPVGD